MEKIKSEYHQKKLKLYSNNFNRRSSNTFKNFSNSPIIIDNLSKNIRKKQHHLQTLLKKTKILLKKKSGTGISKNKKNIYKKICFKNRGPETISITKNKYFEQNN